MRWAECGGRAGRSSARPCAAHVPPRPRVHIPPWEHEPPLWRRPVPPDVASEEVLKELRVRELERRYAKWSALVPYACLTRLYVTGC
jgi:hypothetical protein